MKKQPQKGEALEALRKIKQTEAKARGIIKDAREKTALEIIQDANDEARKIKERQLNDARKGAEEKRKVIVQKALSEAEKIRNKAEEEAHSQRKRAEREIPDAITKVANKMRQFLGGGSF